MVPEWLFQKSQEPAACPFPWPDPSSPRCPIRCLKDPVWDYAPLSYLIFPVVTLSLSLRFPHVTSFLSPSVPRAPHISYFLIWKPSSIWWGVNLMRPKYATFSGLLLLPTLRLKCLPQHSTVDCPQRMFSLPWGYLNVYWG